MNINGTNLTKITDDDFNQICPIVNLNINKILFTQGGDYRRGNLFIMDLDGTNKTQVTFNLSVDKYFLLNNGEIIADIVEGVSINSYKINLSNKDKEKIDNFYYYNSDNSKIAYIKGHKEIWIMNSDGSNNTKIYELEIQDFKDKITKDNDFEICSFLFLFTIAIIFTIIYLKFGKK